jgi:lysozyme family protein
VSAAFDAAFLVVLGVEGGYTDDPADPGNWTGGRFGNGTCNGTNWGISAAAFPHLDIPKITVETAKALYEANYWKPVRGDELPAGLGLLVFDCAVNQGVHTAIIALQLAAGVMTDGWIGPETLAAVRKAGMITIINNTSAERAVLYAGSRDWPTFGRGWMRRLFTVTAKALANVAG